MSGVRWHSEDFVSTGWTTLCLIALVVSLIGFALQQATAELGKRKKSNTLFALIWGGGYVGFVIALWLALDATSAPDGFIHFGVWLMIFTLIFLAICGLIVKAAKAAKTSH